MATSDGISTNDWDKVHELALDIANASLRAEKGEEVKGVVEAYKMELLNHLDSLARKYGPLPTILATRADYIDDIADKIGLFNEAYKSAKTRGDIHNELAVASHSRSCISRTFNSLLKAKSGSKSLGNVLRR